MPQAHSIPPSGNPLIDQQHAQLNALIQQAALAARDGGGPEPFGAALAEFRRVLARHFAVEKVIYSGAGFDAAASHDSAHAAILRRLDGILESLDSFATPASRHLILDELEQTLLDHEMLEDAAYWDAVRAHSGNSPLKWTGLMVIGIDWVDDQHHRMVDLFNRLSRASRDHAHADCADLMRQFLELTRIHFAAEERYLEASGGPLSHHRAEHARMLGQLDELAAADGHKLGVLVDHYLRFWVMEHILGIDRRDLGGDGQGARAPG
ncbi:hemerythrin family protein [Magnetospirillum sp. ME-1]|uniref:hemerythrin family protein n=1 Tax=Magnetospirillum sp. ME-1 TaxID=1639348 RepID=UPI0011AE2B98|nr:hemerythrin family protein [Magnetospirillum sp. ME-1]